MAKSQKNTKQTIAIKSDSLGHQVEQSVISDDSLLPEASEVERYYALDPTILDWLKERAAKEQDFRHASYAERAALVDKNEARIFKVNVIGLIFAFIFLTGGLASSVYLILNRCTITGSIFTGLSIILGGALLAGRKMPNVKATPVKKPNG